MRVTEHVIANNYLLSVNRTREQIVKLQTELATGKRVLKSSDNPQAADVILRLNGLLKRNDQFLGNVTEAQSIMETTTSALDNFSNTLIDVKQTVTEAVNGTRESSYSVMADDMDELLAQVVNIANTRYNGRYIFGGTNTLDAPYILAADHSVVTSNPAGIGGSIEFDVGEGISQLVNIDGQSAFLGTQIFDRIIQIRDSLRAGTAPSSADVDAITSMIDTVASAASKAGSILQNLDTLSTQLNDQNTQLQSLLSVQQDTDVAEATLNLKQAELMLQAALNTGSQILPKTLLDYL
jgi:flagellar hook-associated protein 3 FlgL